MIRCGAILLAVGLLSAEAAQAQNLVATTDLRPIKMERADYPAVAESQALEGWVLLEFTVAADGTTKDIKVVDSSSRVFEPNTIKAIEKFLYEPATVNGVPVERPGVRFRYLYAFRAQDKAYTSGIQQNRMSRFRSLARANEEKKDDEVKRLIGEISEITTLSIYEHAVLAHMKADVAIRADDSPTARAALERVPWDVPSIPDNMRHRAWMLLATLNAFEDRWGPALYAYGQLKLVGKTDMVPASFRAALDDREQRGRVRDPKDWRRQRVEGSIDRECEGSGRPCPRGYGVLLTASNIEAIEVLSTSSSLGMLRLECGSRSYALSAGRRAVYLAPLPQERCELWMDGSKGANYTLDVLFSDR